MTCTRSRMARIKRGRNLASNARIARAGLAIAGVALAPFAKARRVYVLDIERLFVALTAYIVDHARATTSLSCHQPKLETAGPNCGGATPQAGDGVPAMSDTNRTALLTLLVASYDDLKQRLTRRAGSADVADEVLQDTFLRLNSATVIGPVRDLHAYLFRVAMSVASNRRVAERRRLTVSETDALFDLPDDSPGPDRIIEARSEIDALKRVIDELPLRRREILIAIFVDEEPLRQVAERFGISVRTVQVEIKQALAHCAVRLDRGMNVSGAAYRRPGPFDRRDLAHRTPPPADGAAARRWPIGGGR